MNFPFRGKVNEARNVNKNLAVDYKWRFIQKTQLKHAD